MSGETDVIRAALSHMAAGPPDNGVSHRRALAAAERLEAKLGVALSIIEANDPSGDLILEYLDATTEEALSQ
jgi:hypothetical protein